MGTTCLAVAILTPEVYVAYVGDSRLYLLRERWLSTNSPRIIPWLAKWCAKGIITRDQARHHEERNVLSMAMGGRPEIKRCLLAKNR